MLLKGREKKKAMFKNKDFSIDSRVPHEERNYVPHVGMWMTPENL